MPNDESRPSVVFTDEPDSGFCGTGVLCTVAPKLAATAFNVCLDSKTLITIRPDGTVEAPTLEAASEAGRVFVESVRGYLRPQWRPIESAPRDGTWVLLAGGRTYEDFYTNDEAPPCVNRAVTGAWSADECAGAVRCDDYGYTSIDWWMMTFWDGAWRSGYVDPTHWMPLPEAPEGV